jgi:hypothetical protein
MITRMRRNGVKISDKTLRAAEKAAKERGKTLDAWVEEVLSAAASARPSGIEARLQKISEKLDRIADRQSLGEMAADRLSAALQDLESVFRRGRKGAGQIFEKAEARTSSAAGEVAEKVRELIGRATEFAATFAPRRDDASQDAPPPNADAETTAATGSAASSGEAVAEPNAKKTTRERTRKTRGAWKKAAAGVQSRPKRGKAASSKPSASRRRSR